MKKVFLLLSIAFLSLTTNAQKKKVPVVDSFATQMKEMLGWFEGEFDNFQQVYKEKEDKVKEVHEHIHSIFKKVSIPAFGDNVFYVIQYMDGDTSKVYRQRIYSFTTDRIEQATRLDIYSFKNDTPYYYANLAPQKLASLTKTDMTITDGCGVWWKKIDGKYIGYMKEKACNFISKRSGKKIYITDSLQLTPNEIWIRDEAYDENGGYVFGHKGKIPHKLKRCTFYKGWILLQKAGFENEYHQFRNQIWHDQGKRIRLLTEDGKSTKYEIELAAVIYGKELEVLKIALYEVGVSKAITYSWASPGTKNIGINLRWLQAGLTKQD
ncbi:MAG: hypothetical protein RL596_1693 [Bacteroidota bacterium]